MTTEKFLALLPTLGFTLQGSTLLTKDIHGARLTVDLKNRQAPAAMKQQAGGFAGN